MSAKIVQHSKRVSPTELAILQDAGTAAACEAQGRKNLLAQYMRPVFPGVKCAGPALTVSVPKGDNLMLLAAIELAEPGDVLVLSPDRADEHAYFGDMMASFAKRRGCAGLIIDAGVRDIADLRAMNFPVWAKSICAAGTDRGKAGSINVPIICAGIEIRAGDVVVADDDGVCVVPYADVSETVQKIRQRQAKEEAIKQRLQAGELGLDVFAMRDIFNALDIPIDKGD